MNDIDIVSIDDRPIVGDAGGRAGPLLDESPGECSAIPVGIANRDVVAEGSKFGAVFSGEARRLLVPTAAGAHRANAQPRMALQTPAPFRRDRPRSPPPPKPASCRGDNDA